MNLTREQAAKIVKRDSVTKSIQHENDHLRDVLGPPVINPDWPSDPGTDW